MPLITSISDRMIALELGHPIVEGTPEEVIHDQRVVVVVPRRRHGHDQPVWCVGTDIGASREASRHEADRTPEGAAQPRCCGAQEDDA